MMMKNQQQQIQQMRNKQMQQQQQRQFNKARSLIGDDHPSKSYTPGRLKCKFVLKKN